MSSDNGVYPLRNSEGDLLDDDSLEDGENDAHTTADEAVFAEPRVRKIALHYKCAQSKAKTKLSNKPIGIKENFIGSQWELKVKIR